MDYSSICLGTIRQLGELESMACDSGCGCMKLQRYALAAAFSYWLASIIGVNLASIEACVKDLLRVGSRIQACVVCAAEALKALSSTVAPC